MPCLSLLLAGCNDSDSGEINSQDTSIGFKEPVLKLKETVDFVTIPIVVSNDVVRNGDIVVNVTMKGSNANFELDKDIIITTQTLRIPPQESEMDLEVGLHVYNPEIVSGRNVEFEITGAQGASVGPQNTFKINIEEKNFVEGTYEIKGVDAFYDSAMYGKARVIALDETLDNLRLDFGIGGQAVIKMTEIIAEREYEFEILPFQFIGTYNSADVYVSWFRKKFDSNKEPSEVEENGLYYDKTRPMKGKFVRTMEDGKEKSIVITMDDAFGLLGDWKGKYEWFSNVWMPKATFTKID